MIVVDDRLALEVLSGRRQVEGAATTWGFHYRLVRALQEVPGRGILSREATEEVRSVVESPPADLIVVLDPRIVTGLAADMSRRHGLNLLAAEMIASAVHHRADLHISSGNVGRSWPEVCAAESIRLVVV